MLESYKILKRCVNNFSKLDKFFVKSKIYLNNNKNVKRYKNA